VRGYYRELVRQSDQQQTEENQMTTHRETIRRISETLATANLEMLKHLRHLSTPQWTELMAEYKKSI